MVHRSSRSSCHTVVNVEKISAIHSPSTWKDNTSESMPKQFSSTCPGDNKLLHGSGQTIGSASRQCHPGINMHKLIQSPGTMKAYTHDFWCDKAIKKGSWCHGFRRSNLGLPWKILIWYFKPDQPIIFIGQATYIKIVRQWPEVYDLCHTFLHVVLVRKHTDMRELHVFCVQLLHVRVFSDSRNVQIHATKSDT